MDKGIGVCLADVGAEIFAFAGAAVLAAALRIPSVLTAFVPQVALLVAEGGGNAVLAVGKLGAVECPAAHLGGEIGTGNAENLLGHNMVDALLQVGYLLFKSCQQPLGNLPQEDTALAARVEKACLGAAEQLLRQQVKHPVGQLWRSEDLVATEVGQAVQNVRRIILFHYRFYTFLTRIAI